MQNRRLSRRSFLKLTAFAAVSTVAISAGGLTYAYDIEPGWVDITSLKLRLPRLDPAFHGYRVAQISDIHMGTGMTLDRLRHIVNLINQQQPDMAAITGDFVTHGSLDRLVPLLVEGLSGLQAVDGGVAVLGNHDHWTNPATIREVIRRSGLLDISNGVKIIRRGDAVLTMAGVDDHWERQDRLDDVLLQIPEAGAAILLAHEPDYADISAAAGRFDLQISGHSHGGQVILPFIGPLVLPRHGRKYPVGQYQVGDMIQYTNRGVGTIHPAVRFNCRPEITVFTLESPQV